MEHADPKEGVAERETAGNAIGDSVSDPREPDGGPGAARVAVSSISGCRRDSRSDLHIPYHKLQSITATAISSSVDTI